MVNLRRFNTLCALLGLCFGCRNDENTIKKQEQIIAEITTEKISVFEYNESKTEIKVAAGQLVDNKYRGKVIFFEKGNLSKMIYINPNGYKIGDESFFKQNKLISHNFWRDSVNLLFYVNFKNDMQVEKYEGKPWLIRGKPHANMGDTAQYYIATPIIPYHKTLVTFGDERFAETIINYENDIRQFIYKIPVSEPDNYNFKLEVDIVNMKGDTIISDSTSVALVVKGNSQN